MYRKLIAVPLLGFVGLSFAHAYTLTNPPDGAWVTVKQIGDGVIGGTVVVLALLAVLVAAMRAGTFNPGQRYPVWLAALKYMALAAGGVVAVFLLTRLATWAGLRAAALFYQTQVPLLKALAASYALRSLPEAAGLSVFLAAPLFWLIRGVQVRSLPRATFEAWVEAKRLVLPGILLLVAGAVLEAWAGPALTTWILR